MEPNGSRQELSSHVYARDSATPPSLHGFSEECKLVHPHLQDPPEHVPINVLAPIIVCRLAAKF